MEKIEKMTSVDIVAENIEKLKQLFPTIVKEGKISVEELQAVLGDYVEKDKEYYQMTWAGKTQAQQEANRPSTGTLRPCKEESKDWDSTENLFIEGDNLEVLKLLQKSYNNKIKMIYIDPPYNTGKDFVYKDNYKDNLQNYFEITGQIDEEGKKLSTNAETAGRYHSNWLNMMYPRLKLARNLLTEDGVIFISIDDNEQANLKKLCDEVFGEENFVGTFIWERAFSPKNDAKFVSNSHDYILMFAKNIDGFTIGRLPRTEKANSRYSNPDNDPRGVWTSSDISVKTYNENYDYSITTPSGRTVTPPTGRCWRFSKESFERAIKDNRVWFGADGNGIPRIKRFLTELKFDGMVPVSLLFHKQVGHSQEGAKEVTTLLDAGVFDGPKPTRLLNHLLTLSNLQKNSIALDFFSGSSTTAHAVLELNAEDAGQRKCISIQLPEPTHKKGKAYKAGYKSIAEIGKERIRRAGEKIKEDFKDKEGIEDLDVGFRVFKLDSSNMVAWDTATDKLEAQLKLYAENNAEHIKKGRNAEDVLYEILLKLGLDLTVPIQQKELAGHQVYNIGFGTLYVCLDDSVRVEIAHEIGEWHKEFEDASPTVIFKDTGFAQDQDKTNTLQMLKQFGIINVKSI